MCVLPNVSVSLDLKLKTNACVLVNQLEPLFQLSRLSGEEFSQIW